MRATSSRADASPREAEPPRHSAAVLMCGIVGVVSSEPIQERRWLVAGRDALRHRGPDDAGEWWSADARAWLGHRRLAIIDLSPAGAQPMLDRGGDLALTFNGEIYNYRELRSELAAARAHVPHLERHRGDCSHAYRAVGRRLSSRLERHVRVRARTTRQRRRSSCLARDRAGEKPLFYRHRRRTLIRFASELKAFLADRVVAAPRWTPRRSTAILAYRLCRRPTCASSTASASCRRRTRSPSTSQRRSARGRALLAVAEPRPERGCATSTSSLDELERLLERLGAAPADRRRAGRHLLERRRRLEPGDRDGGARGEPSDQDLQQSRFPGHGDLRRSAARTARRAALRHRSRRARRRGRRPSTLLPLLARQFDEPIADSSMVPTYLLEPLIRVAATVALGGDGGDELFGGYPHYDRLLRMQRATARVPRTLRSAVGAASTLLPTAFRAAAGLALSDPISHTTCRR